MCQVFRQRVIALFLERKLIDRSRAASMLSWRHSGFSLDGSIGLYAGDQKAMERLAQYMARPPIALSKVVLEEWDGKVLFHTRYNPYFKENLNLFAVTDFIAEFDRAHPSQGSSLYPPLRALCLKSSRHVEQAAASGSTGRSGLARSSSRNQLWR